LERLVIFIPYPYFCGLCDRPTPYLATLPESAVPVGQCCHSAVKTALTPSEGHWKHYQTLEEIHGANHILHTESPHHG